MDSKPIVQIHSGSLKAANQLVLSDENCDLAPKAEMPQVAELQAWTRSWEVIGGFSSTALMRTGCAQLLPGAAPRGFETSWRNLIQWKALPLKLLYLRLAL